MAERLNINPTRMELSRLKRRLTTARRGHKLLKDKNDELMKRFLELIREARDLRKSVEEHLAAASRLFASAKSLMSEAVLEEAFLMPKEAARCEMKTRNIMSVHVPVFSVTESDAPGGIYPYGLGDTTGELDEALRALSAAGPTLLRLAELEKTITLLALEIEKTRRRVNALEHVLIPRYEATAAYIVMKLDENERGNLVRLMKAR